MKATDEQRKAVEQIRKDYTLPTDLRWWVRDNELFLRLDERTIFGVHSSGMITKHINNANGGA
jgi:hypothetical protein